MPGTLNLEPGKRRAFEVLPASRRQSDLFCRQDAGSTLRDSWVVSMALMPCISITNPPLPLPGGELTGRDERRLPSRFIIASDFVIRHSDLGTAVHGEPLGELFC